MRVKCRADGELPAGRKGENPCGAWPASRCLEEDQLVMLAGILICQTTGIVLWNTGTALANYLAQAVLAVHSPHPAAKRIMDVISFVSREVCKGGNFL